MEEYEVTTIEENESERLTDDCDGSVDSNQIENIIDDLRNSLMCGEPSNEIIPSPELLEVSEQKKEESGGIERENVSNEEDENQSLVEVPPEIIQEFGEGQWSKTYQERGETTFDFMTGEMMSKDGNFSLTKHIKENATEQQAALHEQIIKNWIESTGAAQLIAFNETKENIIVVHVTKTWVEAEGQIVSETWSKTTEKKIEEPKQLDQEELGSMSDDHDEYADFTSDQKITGQGFYAFSAETAATNQTMEEQDAIEEVQLEALKNELKETDATDDFNDKPVQIGEANLETKIREVPMQEEKRQTEELKDRQIAIATSEKEQIEPVFSEHTGVVSGAAIEIMDDEKYNFEQLIDTGFEQESVLSKEIESALSETLPVTNNKEKDIIEAFGIELVEISQDEPESIVVKEPDILSENGRSVGQTEMPVFQAEVFEETGIALMEDSEKQEIDMAYPLVEAKAGISDATRIPKTIRNTRKVLVDKNIELSERGRQETIGHDIQNRVRILKEGVAKKLQDDDTALMANQEIKPYGPKKTRTQEKQTSISNRELIFGNESVKDNITNTDRKNTETTRARYSAKPVIVKISQKNKLPFRSAELINRLLTFKPSIINNGDETAEEAIYSIIPVFESAV